MKTQIDSIQKKTNFSGTVLVKDKNKELIDLNYGYANRAEKLKNHSETRYGIASGSKIFTSVAICQLVEEGKLSFDTRIKEYLDFEFPNFHEEITIHQLLTHTSGVPDYFDEEVMEDFEELWIDNPMYHIRGLQDFLPLFQHKNMHSLPGEQFHYNNGGYILLGLIVEKASGLRFTDYVQTRIFNKIGMLDSGYFALDSLPGNTAMGYIDLDDGTWKTNIYSLPVQGGSDGGVFVTAKDMITFWEALANYELLNESLTNLLLTPHAKNEDGEFYGYGVWIEKNADQIVKYHIMGYDPGVCFHSAFYPNLDIHIAICSNISFGAYDVMEVIEVEIAKVIK